MMGYNAGFVWSLLNRTERYYRVFEIPKGRGTRAIQAPKIAIKIIQKWLSVHFQKRWRPSENVHGFVPGRSHLSAASRHLGARWVYSVDIENFFPSISALRVADALKELGYRTTESLDCLTRICCLGSRLVQGAPTSPVLSNIALHDIDEQLTHLSLITNTAYTRYADDVVFSGTDAFSVDMAQSVERIFLESGWILSDHKSILSVFPDRLKVHGLLVHGDAIRLTKGYRNRIRAFRHLSEKNLIKLSDQRRIYGHLNYSRQVAIYSKEEDSLM
jgi:RNA-directed DNA polymerase